MNKYIKSKGCINLTRAKNREKELTKEYQFYREKLNKSLSVKEAEAYFLKAKIALEQ